MLRNSSTERRTASSRVRPRRMPRRPRRPSKGLGRQWNSG